MQKKSFENTCGNCRHFQLHYIKYGRGITIRSPMATASSPGAKNGMPLTVDALTTSRGNSPDNSAYTICIIH